MKEEKAIERIHDLIHTCDVGIAKHGEYDDLFLLDKQALETVLNLIKTQKAELEPIKKLNIPVETLVAEFNRLEDLEDNTVMLKAEIEKRDAIISKMANALDIAQDRYEYMGIDRIIEYFTELAEEKK